MKIAAMAEAFNAEMAPHLYAGPIEWAANLHLCTACPNALIAESISTPGSFHEALVTRPYRVEAGHVRVDDAPGLGLEIDERVARAHPYTGDRLHLEMQETPHVYDETTYFAGGSAD